MLGEYGEIMYGYFIYEVVIYILLILKGFGIDLVVVLEQVCFIDVVLIVFVQFGCELLVVVQGVDLILILQGELFGFEVYFESWYLCYYYGWSELWVLQDGCYKLIQVFMCEFYDFEVDLIEQNNFVEIE